MTTATTSNITAPPAALGKVEQDIVRRLTPHANSKDESRSTLSWIVFDGEKAWATDGRRLVMVKHESAPYAVFGCNGKVSKAAGAVKGEIRAVDGVTRATVILDRVLRDSADAFRIPDIASITPKRGDMRKLGRVSGGLSGGIQRTLGEANCDWMLTVNCGDGEKPVGLNLDLMRAVVESVGPDYGPVDMWVNINSPELSPVVFLNGENLDNWKSMGVLMPMRIA